MSINDFPVDAYLKQIGLDKLPDATSEGLSTLVRAQGHSIAFENLDVLAGVPVRLEPDAIVDKILNRRRGGYCYELNGLIALALGAAGFQVNPMLARVTYRRTEPGPRAHLILRVDCGDGAWLVDVGFGAPGLVGPIRLDPDRLMEQDGVRFRLVTEPDGDVHLKREVAGAWVDLYRFSETEVPHSDIETSNHFISTHHKSPFRNRFMCIAPQEWGAWQIEGRDLLCLDRQNNVVERTSMRGERDLVNAMHVLFKVDIPGDIAGRAWAQVCRCEQEEAHP